MVSNANDDLPEPLTPVTTVMALCGTSTETFFRLWTRAPWTRKMSGSGCNPSVDALICFVAKREPRQQVSKPRPKLQIIKPLSKASKPRLGQSATREGYQQFPGRPASRHFGGRCPRHSNNLLRIEPVLSEPPYVLCAAGPCGVL